MNVSIAAVCAAAVLCVCCLICGCTDSGEGTEITLVVMTAEPTPAPDIADVDEGWNIWREGSVSIGRLGEFQSYKPNKNGEYFRNLRVEVKATGPLTLLFLMPDELVNFKNKMMTNAGDYYPVARYDDVTSGTYTRVGDDDLTIALLNEENRPVTATVNIWYHD
ncbi:hypothetical protein L1S32_08505 [Methanogenium sp. S4BF]|uniref:hypothetical protein n=1 Tax=Methanogenium sp. S4BF TaxID=1789226 RepID=UPI0024160684|nr:hypothetical protein [Methanogenium sp. S4BF]WFN33882.1 hypothetical protein L1S32_08505 [Methanogenium sp. S4BF]